MTFDTASRSMMGAAPAEFTSFAVVRDADFTCAKFGIPAYEDGTIHRHHTPKLIAS